MSVKMILTVPTTADVPRIIDTVLEKVRGRYWDTDYYREITVPEATFDKAGGRISAGKWQYGYACFFIEATELDPAIISAIDDLAKTFDIAYSWRNDKRVLYEKYWWLPPTKFFEGTSMSFEDRDNYGRIIYDSQAARLAADWYDTKLAELENRTQQRPLAGA